jgi:transcription termination/antitermination factor NusG
MYDLLKERGCGHIKIFGGGGGTILPEEIKDLQDYGITRIYHPDDGRAMGLQGMINDVLMKSDFPTGANLNGEVNHLKSKDHKSIAKLISAAENFNEESKAALEKVRASAKESKTPVIGITGTGGSGKSSLVDELVRRFLLDFPDKKIGIVSVDPSKRKTGGALLGGKRVEVEEKVYPGYVLVDMVVTDDSWYVVRNTPRVTGFVGAGVNPVPLNKDEMAALFKTMDDTQGAKHNIDLITGEIVRIADGPFKDLEGKVDAIDQERGKIRVLVSMFGRETPVELDFLQIKKI